MPRPGSARSANCSANWPSNGAGCRSAGCSPRYGELITAIMPCMLVSPDSLARFFPPRPGLFDLVVFDEASQIRVADAVGAMGRGTVRGGGRRQQADAADVVRRTEHRWRRRRGCRRGRSRGRAARGGRGEHPVRMRAGQGAAALAVLALPQPGRVADRLQQPAVLRRRSVVLPSAAQSGLPDPGIDGMASTWSASTASSSAAGPGSCCAPTRSRPERSSTRSGAGSPPTR